LDQLTAHHGESLSASLERILTSGASADGVQIGEIVDAAGEKGFGLLLTILALPSALPLPAPGYSTPFGIALIILGFQMILGRKKPQLPGWIRRRTIPRRMGEKMIAAAVKASTFIEKFIRPRMKWIQGRTGVRLTAVLVMLMAGLMIIPMPGTNTIPAGAIFLIGIALTEEDGLFGVLALLVGLMATAIYAFAVYLIAIGGAKGFEGAIDLIRDRLSGG